jgi:hypothetical protein
MLKYFGFPFYVICFLLQCLLFWKETNAAAIARFSLSNTGIQGNITINDREVIVNLDLTNVNYSKFASNTGCFTNGMKYHIHKNWLYSDVNDRIGAGPCGSTYLGGHWDPWAACSNSTSNAYCLSSKVSGSCIKSSSSFHSNGNYVCNTTVYGLDPYSCEVGDFSGKYGVLRLTNNKVYRKDSSFWEVTASDVIGKSIVFHCSTAGDPRAFCSVFQDNGVSTSTNVIQQPAQSVIANFNSLSSDSYILLHNNGTYNINLNVHNISSCSNMTYRIFDSWNAYSSNANSSFLGSACGDVVGSAYDFTARCLPNTDSQFCFSNKLCNDTAYKYSCSSLAQRYNCSPSDLSGKYGTINTNNAQSKTISIKGYDPLMIDLSKLNGTKSVVLQCSGSSSIVACAKFSPYIPTTIITTTSSSGSKHHRRRHRHWWSFLEDIFN